jgi:hypothetical protein
MSARGALSHAILKSRLGHAAHRWVMSGKSGDDRREKDPSAVAGTRGTRLLSRAQNADAWIWIVSRKDAKKGGGNSRAARLEAQLRVNLKKRKQQARARARGVDAEPRDPKDASPEGGEE